MSDEGGGHHAYVTNDRPGSMLLKCYQHCGSEYLCFEFVDIMCFYCSTTILLGRGGGRDRA